MMKGMVKSKRIGQSAAELLFIIKVKSSTTIPEGSSII